MGNLTDMARDESEKPETSALVQEDKYPYGLRINLDKHDLEKLDVDHGDWEIGDVFALDVLVKVVSKSINESEGGNENCNISLQVTHIGAEEDHEEEESEEHEDGAYHKDEGSEPSLERHGYLRYNT